MNNKAIINLLIISLFVLFSTSAFTQTEKHGMSPEMKHDMAVFFGEKGETQRAAAAEYAQWSNQLQKYLVASEDPFSMAMTLASQVSSVQTSKFMAKTQKQPELEQQLNDLSYQPIADALNVLLTQKDLSPETLDILTHVCFNQFIKDHCHANVLLQKRMEADFENLQVYLRPFALAYQANNKASSEKLMTLMANSQFSQNVLFITPKMNQLIDEFIADNPVPDSYIESMVEDYKKLSGVSAETKQQLTELMPSYMPVFVKSSLRFLNDLPPYRPVLEYCQKNASAVEQCQSIAQIMIQKSNATIDKAMGHAILIASYEATEDHARAKAAYKLNDMFKSTYQCIQRLNSDPHFIDNYFDPEYQKITAFPNDEFEMAIQLAEYRYQKMKSNGTEELINPETCFETQQ